VTSFALELVVYPVIYLLWRQRGLPAAPADDELAAPPTD